VKSGKVSVSVSSRSRSSTSRLHPWNVQLLPRQRDTPQLTGKSSQTAREVLKTFSRINANMTTACEDNIGLVSPLALTISRILVGKPHSGTADCERIISAYNRVKTDSRSSLCSKTTMITCTLMTRRLYTEGRLLRKFWRMVPVLLQ